MGNNPRTAKERQTQSNVMEETNMAKKQSLLKRIIKTLIVGGGVFVLLIIAGILTGIATIPLIIVAFFTGPVGAIISGGFGVLIGIYFLGFIFERFKPKLTKK